MKEAAIIFQGSMVRAIMAGQKTETRRLRKPNYTKGDVLWIRENTMFHPCNNFLYRAGMGKTLFCSDMTNREIVSAKQQGWIIKPSIHVPKVFSRIKLKVFGVWGESLQMITDSGAIAEGVGYGFSMEHPSAGYPDYQHIKPNGVCECTQDTARMSFATLWDSINGKTADFRWDSNPYVYVTRFELLEVKYGKEND